MLARIRKSMEENQEGFTLIELLVVIIIIGILAAIAIPVFLNQRKKGYQASEKSDLRTVANEMETYFTDYQAYPAGFGASQATASATGTGQVGNDTVTLSAGNTITIVRAGTQGFCLTSNSSKDGGTTYYTYDSMKGGLQSGTTSAAGGACQAASVYQ